MSRTKTLALTGVLAVTGAFMATGVAAHASTVSHGKAALADAAVVANLKTDMKADQNAAAGTGGSQATFGAVAANLVEPRADDASRSADRAALPAASPAAIPAALAVPASVDTAAADQAAAEAAAAATPKYSNNLDGWINEARDILAANGTKVSYNAIYQAAIHESGGNPTVVNGWDINAKNGIPSIGLLQVIQPTFDAYKLAGHNDIKDPVDNIIAGVRYAEHRYGSMDKVVADRCGGSCWRGY